jgi:hypothetical protein
MVAGHGRSQQWRPLHTEADCELEVMETYPRKEAWRERLPPAELAEYSFRQCDHCATRAANFIVLGDSKQARALLRGSFPFRTLFNCIRRRKVHVFLLRGLMKGALLLRSERALARLQVHTEYGGRIPS